MKNHPVRHLLPGHRRGSAVRGAAFGLSLAAAVGGSADCGLEAGGSGDLFDGDAGIEEGGGKVDARAEGGARGEAGFDARVEPPGDTGAPPVDAPACVPSTELCDDHIDNDCDGLVDCADPACQPRFACTAPVPAGWVLSEYSPTSRPACDALFPAARDVVETPKGEPATCACTCANDPSNTGRCDLGAASLLLGSDASCTPGDRAVVDVSTGVGGLCGKLPSSLDVSADTNARVIAPSYVPGACTVNATSFVPPVTSDGDGRVCATTSPLGGGCGSQAVCAPTISPAFAACVSHAGLLACPAGYPKAHVLGAQVTDTRACTACTCLGTGTCQSPTLTLYSSGDCGSDGGGGATLPLAADGTCQALPASGGTTYNRFTYAATPTASACARVGPAPIGTVSVGDPATVCCR